MCYGQNSPVGGYCRILLSSVGDERRQLSQPALFVSSAIELYSVEGKGVGLPACRAHLEGRSCELLCLFGVAVQQGERGVEETCQPQEHRLPKLLRHRTHSRQTFPRQLELAGADGER
jgi:hypothetical protein